MRPCARRWCSARSGSEPLSSDKHALGGAYRTVRRRVATLIELGHRVRRALFIARLRAAAVWHRSKIDLVVAPDLQLGRRVRVVVDPRDPHEHSYRSANAHRRSGAAPAAWWQHRVRARNLAAARRRASTCPETSRWSRGTCCRGAPWSTARSRCDREPLASAAEGVSVSDATHFYTTPEKFFYHNTRTDPIVIGANTLAVPEGHREPRRADRIALHPGAELGGHRRHSRRSSRVRRPRVTSDRCRCRGATDGDGDGDRVAAEVVDLADE